MSWRYECNDGRFPDDAQVEVRYPARVASDGLDEGRWVAAVSLPRDDWPWLPATVRGQCGPDEWHVRLDVEGLAEEDEETGELWFPAVFRDASELRLTAGSDVGGGQ